MEVDGGRRGNMRGEASGRVGITDCEAGVRTGFAMTRFLQEVWCRAGGRTEASAPTRRLPIELRRGRRPRRPACTSFHIMLGVLVMGKGRTREVSALRGAAIITNPRQCNREGRAAGRWCRRFYTWCNGYGRRRNCRYCRRSRWSRPGTPFGPRRRCSHPCVHRGW